MACRIRFFICLLLDLLFLGIYLFEQFVHSGDQLVVNARSRRSGVLATRMSGSNCLFSR